MQLRLALSRFPASWLQPQIATHVAALAKAMRIFQREQERQRDQRAYSLDLLQQLDLRITRLRQRFDSVVVLRNAFAQFFDRRQQWTYRPTTAESLRFELNRKQSKFERKRLISSKIKTRNSRLR